jgi:hypothetical protein
LKLRLTLILNRIADNQPFLSLWHKERFAQGDRYGTERAGASDLSIAR